MYYVSAYVYWRNVLFICQYVGIFQLNWKQTIYSGFQQSSKSYLRSFMNEVWCKYFKTNLLVFSFATRKQFFIQTSALMFLRKYYLVCHRSRNVLRN